MKTVPSPNTRRRPDSFAQDAGEPTCPVAIALARPSRKSKREKEITQAAGRYTPPSFSARDGDTLCSFFPLCHQDRPAQLFFDSLGRIRGFTTQSATRTTCTISATSCTRTTCAPFKILAVTVAAVPQTRSSIRVLFPFRSSAAPKNPLREVPAING